MVTNMKNIVIMGETGVGKNYIQNFILNNYPKYSKIVTYTTRPMRKNEVNGIDYIFISDKEFENKIKNNELLEYQEYKTQYGIWKYGTPKNIPNENSIIILDKNGYDELIKIMDCHLFYVKCYDAEKRIYMALMRNKEINKDTVEELFRRVFVDREKFKNIENNPKLIMIPQFYNEYTLDVVCDIMDNID